MADERIIFFGTSRFALPVLETLAQSEWRPELVVTTPARAAGRGLKPQPSPVKQKALALGLEVWEPGRLRDEADAAKLKKIAPSIIILAAYGGILPSSVLTLPSRGSLNVHPSLLPRWRGPAPIPYTLLESDSRTGVTLFVMDEEIDHGAIVAQEAIPVAPDDNALTLEAKLSGLGGELLLKTLPSWISGQITPIAQNHALATHSHMIEKSQGAIDWSESAMLIDRKIRAFAGWPGTYTHLEGKLLKIIKAVPNPNLTTSQVVRLAFDGFLRQGGVFSEQKKLLVATGDGALEILELQIEGKKPTTAAAFLNGHQDVIGRQLTA